MSVDEAPEDLALSVYLHEQKAGRRSGSKSLSSAWRKLRSIVIGVLRRRGLWSTPPRYLGIEDQENWSFSDFDPGLPETLSRYSAIDHLTIDCLICIQERCDAYLAKGRNIDALIATIVNQVIHEKQRLHDRLGFRAFSALRGAVRLLLEGGKLFLCAGDNTVNNTTVLGFSSRGSQSSPAELPPEVRTWDDDILSGILFRRLDRANLRQLGESVRSLRKVGIETFRFKNALDRFRNDLRRLNRGIWQHQPEAAELELPGARFEEREFKHKVQECVARRLPGTARGIGMRARTVEHLKKLWGLALCRPPERDAGRFSAYQLEEILGIPRKKVPRLIETLRRIVMECEKQLMEPTDGR